MFQSVDPHMMSKRNPVTFVQLAIILATAFVLKYFYSNASVNDLRWILAPTTFLVEAITGIQFRFESQAGYLSEDRTFLIALPCSGVNFLIIAFLMLALGAMWRERPKTLAWGSLLLATLAAYIATIAANTTRITLALKLRQLDLETTLFDYEDIHRIEGITVYFVFLLLLFFASERFGNRKTGFRHAPRAVIRRLSIPLIVYYVVTLGIPLARGAFREAEFWNHALVVIITPAVLLLPFVIVDVAKAFESKTT